MKKNNSPLFLVMFQINQDNNTDDIIIAAIAKYENDYIEEWIQHHLDIGIDKIYIFDDNPEGYPDMRNLPVVKKYLCRKVFFIKSAKKEQYMQLPFYNTFYKTHKFKWCFFIDIDEFIDLNGFDNIKDYICQDKFSQAEVILLPWKYYGDNDNLSKSDLPVVERFKEPATCGKWIEQAENTGFIECKCAVRSGLPAVFVHPHCPWFTDKLLHTIQTNTGEYFPVWSSVVTMDYSAPFIRHYFTKSAEEFIEKIGRGYADCFRERPLDEYFCINKYTEQKRNALIEYATSYEERYHVKINYGIFL